MIFAIGLLASGLASTSVGTYAGSAIMGTPTLFFSNGERVGGAIPAAQVDKRLKQIEEAK